MKEWGVFAYIGNRDVRYYLNGGIFLKNGFLTEYGANRAAKRKQQSAEDCKIYIQRPDKTVYPVGQKPRK